MLKPVDFGHFQLENLENISCILACKVPQSFIKLICLLMPGWEAATLGQVTVWHVGPHKTTTWHFYTLAFEHKIKRDKVLIKWQMACTCTALFYTLMGLYFTSSNRRTHTLTLTHIHMPRWKCHAKTVTANWSFLGASFFPKDTRHVDRRSWRSHHPPVISPQPATSWTTPAPISEF